jgi:hypothetical protein
MDIQQLDKSHEQQVSALERRFESQIEGIKRQKISEKISLEKRHKLERERFQSALDARGRINSN